MDSHEVRSEWAGRTGEYSPAYYAHYGANETSEILSSLVGDAIDRDGRILELGCSSGRHLAALMAAGYDDLHGIEINDAAFDVMAEVYPDLAETGTFHLDAIEDAVVDFGDDSFDAVYSVQTLQHIHPDESWVFAELARVTDSLLVVAEREEGVDGDESGDVTFVRDEFPLYFRDWEAVFTDLGFEQVAVRDGKRTTVRAFEPTH